MADQVRLQVQKRGVLGKAVRKLRRQGVLPGNIASTREHPPVPVQLDMHEFDRMLKTHGRTTLYRLVIAPDGGEDTVLVRHIMREPATGAMQHVDFMHVEMNQPIRAKIPVHLIGEPPAVKQLDGVMLHLADTIEVEALPGDLPEAVELDVSGLDQLNEALLVRDIPLPARVKLLTPEDEKVVTVTPPRIAVEEVEAPAAEAAEVPEAAAPAEEASES